MKSINRMLAAGMVAGLVTMAPTLAVASGDGFTDYSNLHALSTLDRSDLMALDVMSEKELGETQGEFFNFGLNIAIAPQFNICVFCNGVSQTNIASIFGYNRFR